MLDGPAHEQGNDNRAQAQKGQHNNSLDEFCIHNRFSAFLRTGTGLMARVVSSQTGTTLEMEANRTLGLVVVEVTAGLPCEDA
jgi:hypothetical protein